MTLSIYLDIFFAVNLMMDYFIISITDRILDLNGKMTWKMLGAFLGSLWAVVAVIVRINLKPVTYIVLPVIMIMPVLGIKNRRKIAKSIFVMYMVTFVLSGVCSGLWNMVCSRKINSLILILGLILSVILLHILGEYIKVRKKYGDGIYKVNIKINNEEIRCKGYLDTGNLLKDPYTGRIVHIISKSVLPIEKINIGCRLVPFHSIGNENGLIPVIDVDSMVIYNEKNVIYKGTGTIGIYEGVISKYGMYDALLNGSVLKE